jgi:hypothetical protein
MQRMISGIVEKPVDAQKLIDELTTQCLCDRADIGVMSGPGAAAIPQPEAMSRIASGAGQAAGAAMNAAATLFNGLLGAAATVVSKPVSGVGMLTAAGQLANALSKSAFTGVDGLAKGLNEVGVAQDVARRHAEALQRGAILVVVHAKTENQAQRAQQVFAAHAVAESTH